MPNHLPVPSELQHLIEKRETDDRREKERRSDQDRRIADLGPSGAVESPEEPDPPVADRRTGDERRGDGDRREAARRQPDVESLPPDPPE